MQWGDLWAAFALYLVLEGLMPFLNPGGMKRTLLQLAQLEERTLRTVGLASMIAGALLLYFVRGAG
ncbi:MAG: DUF2065 domain-containing protein [Gammaproteobacteria bacterium]|nr:DUF2065 domain-containing protein [Gammaproteobacteria bacterium]